MYIQNKKFVVNIETYGSLSRTEWKYEGSHRKFAANENLYLTNPGTDENQIYSIRCVRDVEIIP